MGSVCGICRSSRDVITVTEASVQNRRNSVDGTPSSVALPVDSEDNESHGHVTQRLLSRTSEVQKIIGTRKTSDGVTFRRERLGVFLTEAATHAEEGSDFDRENDLLTISCGGSLQNPTQITADISGVNSTTSVTGINHREDTKDNTVGKVEESNEKASLQTDQIHDSNVDSPTTATGANIGVQDSHSDDISPILDETIRTENGTTTVHQQEEEEPAIYQKSERGKDIANEVPKATRAIPPVRRKSTDGRPIVIQRSSERSISSMMVSPFGAIIECPTHNMSLSIEESSLYKILPMVAGDILSSRNQREASESDYLGIIRSYRNTLQEYVMIVLHGCQNRHRPQTLADGLVLNREHDATDMACMVDSFAGNLEAKLSQGIEELEKRFATRLAKLPTDAHEGDINEALVDHVIGIKCLKMLLEKEEKKMTCHDARGGIGVVALDGESLCPEARRDCGQADSRTKFEESVTHVEVNSEDKCVESSLLANFEAREENAANVEVEKAQDKCDNGGSREAIVTDGKTDYCSERCQRADDRQYLGQQDTTENDGVRSDGGKSETQTSDQQELGGQMNSMEDSHLPTRATQESREDIVCFLEKWKKMAEIGDSLGKEHILDLIWKCLNGNESLTSYCNLHESPTVGEITSYGGFWQGYESSIEYVKMTEKELIDLDASFLRLHTNQNTAIGRFRTNSADHVLRQDILIGFLESERKRELRMTNDRDFIPIDEEIEIKNCELRALQRDLALLPSTARAAVVEAVLKKSRDLVVGNLLTRDCKRIEAWRKRPADDCGDANFADDDAAFVESLMRNTSDEKLSKTVLRNKLNAYWLKKTGTLHKVPSVETTESSKRKNLYDELLQFDCKFLGNESDNAGSRQCVFNEQSMQEEIRTQDNRRSDGNGVISMYSSLAALVDDLVSGCADDLDIVEAIYDWLTSRDLAVYKTATNHDEIGSPSWYLREISMSRDTHANLFHKICTVAGVQCCVVAGHVKGSTYLPGDDARIEQYAHSWNMVTVDSKRYLVDSELGAKPEKGSKRHYYLSNPAFLIQSHLPHDCEYQLLRTPYTQLKFQNCLKTWPVLFTSQLRPLISEGVVNTGDNVVTIGFLLSDHYLCGRLDVGDDLVNVDGDVLAYSVEQLVNYDDQIEEFRLRLPCKGTYSFTVLLRECGEDICVCRYRIIYTASI